MKLYIIGLCFFLFCAGLAGYIFFHFSHVAAQGSGTGQQHVDQLLALRKAAAKGTTQDPFGDDDIVRILLIGLDARAGQAEAHCDAIQFIEVNRTTQQMDITAVPRGTYAPLPGTGHQANDYYISNACAIGGIEYGIDHIEKILGSKADYVAFFGFSQTMGILRLLHLPTTETLQWLRHRRSYAVGEPQRARNHSTFIKQLLMQYTPTASSTLDTALNYILYHTVKTDLSFDQTMQIIDAVSTIEPAAHPERIALHMRPAYDVKDIPYNPETLDADLQQVLTPILPYLSADDFSGARPDDIQEKVIAMIEGELKNQPFVAWAYDHQLWLQIDNDQQREAHHYQLLEAYVQHLPAAQAQDVIADYILEMRYLQYPQWEGRGDGLLEQISPRDVNGE